MDRDDLILISVDDHIIEPPDMFDNIAWECDYPHSDSMWPTAPEELAAVLEDCRVPAGDIAKMTHENAMRWYSFDPFRHVAKEQATVGALRKAAEGHDVSIRALSHTR